MTFLLLLFSRPPHYLMRQYCVDFEKKGKYSKEEEARDVAAGGKVSARSKGEIKRQKLNGGRTSGLCDERPGLCDERPGL